MSALSHIGRGIDKKQLTAIVGAGKGQRLIELFVEKPGVLSISHHHARGVGARRISDNQLYFAESDVLLILVEAEFADAVFASLFQEARLYEPGNGMIFMEKVLRGHPMMPFAEADW